MSSFVPTERERAEETLSRELAATQRLQEVSVRLLREEKAEALYEHILDAAVDIMRSQYASIQMFYPARGELRLLGFRGFNPQAAKFWEWVRPASESTCGMALRSGRRCIVADVEKCEFMAGSDDLATYLDTGIRAVQTTPLISRSGELIGMISTHWSEPHQPAEHELRLLDVLARQAADLIERSNVIEKLRQADQRKDEFLAMLAHELRNPLAPISNAVSLLGDADARVSALARGILERQVAHMVRLVEDLLDITRASRGEIGLQKQVLPLAQVVAAAVETSRPLIEAGAHSLTVRQPHRPLQVFADPVRLAQVISNLLNNAARYTPRGGRIELEVSADANAARVSVRDNGAGLDPDELPRLFEMFTQGHATRRRTPGGLGVGLALAKQLAEQHGGSIEARSEGAGKGAEFTVLLPLAPGESPRASAGRAAEITLGRKRILIVDDNRDAGDSLGHLLRAMDAEVRVARDGAEALEAAMSYAPAVVLLDIGMPGLDGFEVARRLRAHGDTSDALLIALTGYGQREDRQRATEAGFDYYFVKPADPREIHGAIERGRSMAIAGTGRMQDSAGL